MDTDRHRQTDCNSQECKCYSLKDHHAKCVLPPADDHLPVGGPLPLSIWATYIGLWGIIKTLRGHKIGKGWIWKEL